ncbi:hypothetical protein [Novosphingobium sp. RL4]|uniref:hypothetical protein n=1 Tax=Novosphingobium TaxID=165696 RepID=UPI002D79F5B1|nr:hypothetical protein [Novosphingobium sp. RL4]WRT92671.1 hypothetical protein U9J33_15935 [Novosphingobium sp. RL4]
MKCRRSLLFVSILALGGCEPLRGVVSEKDVNSRVDLGCVDLSLRYTFGVIERWDYTSDGGIFPKGTEVAQFAYYKSNDGAGWARLDLGEVEKHLRVEHSFTGIGAALPQDYFPPALSAMQKASDAVRTDCHLDLGNMKLKAVGQDIDVLD